MIRPADAAAILDLLSAAFPTHPMSDASTELYINMCTKPPFTDVSALIAAANALVRSTDRFPSVHQLTEAYQAEARRRLNEEADRVRAAGMLPGVVWDPGYAVEMVDVMRTAYERAAAGVVHRHPDGDDSQCPTCSRKDVTAAQITSSAIRLAAERGLRPPPGVETFACPDCRDLGYISTEPYTVRPCGGCNEPTYEPYTVRPCGGCNEPTYERWTGGHLSPGHFCADCRRR